MKVLRILIFAFIFTLVSGLYVERPLTLDAEFVYYGFPFHWLMAGRPTMNPPPNNPWMFTFLWLFFIFDFAVYVLLAVAVTKIVYVKKRKRHTEINS